MYRSIYICDRCGDVYQERDLPVAFGNCTRCGDNLCPGCSSGWSPDGLCAQCQQRFLGSADDHFVETIEIEKGDVNGR